jgi:WXG100 family type VII secretion target
MGKRIRVTPQDLEAASKRVLEISQSYREIYTQLLQTASTMGAAWEGEDNLAFVNQINGFTDKLKAMSDKLETASRALDQIKTNYVQRQEANIAQVSKLTN